MTSYIKYSQDKRDQVKRANPNEKPSKIVQILAKMWKNESDAVKKQYQNDFNVRNEKYLAEKAKLSE